ncbi:MAG: glycosyltransferase family 2 protein [Intestinibacter sp.]|uniref:glycosyltransferase family 2 protein n=1 Tax=Intestinibacter sp. TaxID=1965304 RepID=UPI003F179A98
MDYLISIIIPIYNIEKYIEQCVNSVLEQSYKNFEIILVDDGSKDTSGDICDKYCRLDDRVKVIHKENGGLSSARNTGIKAAKGDYIAFIDGDDYWDDKEFLNCAVECLNEFNADLINFGLKKYYEETDIMQNSKYIFDRSLIDVEDKKKTLDYLISNNLYISSACTKLIKREIIINNNLFFKEGIFSEDIDWSARLLIYSKKIDVINKSPYIYRQRAKSITHTLKKKNIEHVINNIENSISYVPKDCDLKNEYMGYIAYQYLTLMIVQNYIDEKLPKKIRDKIKDLKFLLRYDLNNKVHKFRLIEKYLGFGTLNFIVKIYAKMRRG